MAGNIRIAFLGGLGTIGRNCMWIEDSGKILVIDCGILFPEVRMLGIDIAVPDLSSLMKRTDDIVGVIVTHGHEDHIGALSFLTSHIRCPVAGSELALAFARKRLEEAASTPVDFLVVKDFEIRSFGPFTVEFLPVPHSVPDGYALSIQTSAGLVLHSGDFKLDPDPLDGRKAAIGRMRELAEKDGGVHLLLIDSTNADEPGWTESEREVHPVLSRVMSNANGRRVITTCFSSHLHRIDQIIDVARMNGRTVVPVGRSVEKSVAIGQKLGHLRVEPGDLASIRDLKDLDSGHVCILSAGSQGEPRSALALMGEGVHKYVKIDSDDLVIISADAIPGNETDVARMIDNLSRRGAEVVHAGFEKVHVSGHGKQEELRTVIEATNPNIMIPIHGEYRHMVAARRLAERCSLPPRQVLVCEDGDVVQVDESAARRAGVVPATRVYVSAGSIGGVEEATVRDRQTMMSAGVLVLALEADSGLGRITRIVNIENVGWLAPTFFGDVLPDIEEFLLQELGLTSINREQAEEYVVRKLGRKLANQLGTKPYIVVQFLEWR